MSVYVHVCIITFALVYESALNRLRKDRRERTSAVELVKYSKNIYFLVNTFAVDINIYNIVMITIVD